MVRCIRVSVQRDDDKIMILIILVIAKSIHIFVML